MEIAKNDPRSDTHVKDTKNNKRKPTVSCNDDSYFNLRLFLRQLRSHFIQMIAETDSAVVDLQNEDCVEKSTVWKMNDGRLRGSYIVNQFTMG
ncbi:hypothetical protein E1A91_A09G044500v1 [Gossypium mustelinum]|uniref:Uncharacterized protein n=1 Tax=Gossypium mustelinum TaxID=34275 RepID=A0A5D2XU52_GOSMU|nr:hypothetical protein E1A91_A09G044500v1 [Gossypium mustelinum]